MIALVVSAAWPKYHASSPFLNLLNSSHPDFKVFGVLGEDTLKPEFRDAVNACEALVVDDVLAKLMGFYTKGPKLMIGGDPHAHKPEQAQRLEEEYASVDYVLTGAVFCKKLSPPYFYPPAPCWDKHVYFPHSVPNARIEVPNWLCRKSAALLSGAVSQEVYPFRKRCWDLARAGYPIELLDHAVLWHDQYFKRVAEYRMAITCPSIFECAMAKYFEFPWLGTLLLAPALSKEECNLLGYEDDVNVVWVDNADRVNQAIAKINDHPQKYADVAAAGAALLAKSHTVNSRLSYVAALVEKIRAGGFMPNDGMDIFLKNRISGK